MCLRKVRAAAAAAAALGSLLSGNSRGLIPNPQSSFQLHLLITITSATMIASAHSDDCQFAALFQCL
jgi:hypothetical protein